LSARLVPRTKRPEVGIPLKDSERFTIGRDRSCDLVLADPSTSRAHAVIERSERGWTLRDEGSANGTFVNGRRVAARTVTHGQTLRFGTAEEFRFFDPESAGRGGGWKSLLTIQLVPRDPDVGARAIALGSGARVVGRDANADHVLACNGVSGLHARIEARGGEAVISDHRSTNGTWVNGERIQQTTIRPGDEVAFGDVLFDVRLAPKPSHRGLTAIASGAAVAGIAVLAVVLLPERSSEARLWTKAMYREQARTSLREALEAVDTPGASREVASARFDIAIRSLAAADELPPSGWTDEEIHQALRKASAPMTKNLAGRDIAQIYATLHERPADAAAPAAMEFPQPGSAPPAAPPPTEVATGATPPSPPAPSSAPPDPVPSFEFPSSPGTSPRATAAGPALVRAELAAIVAEFGIDADRQEIPPTLLAEVERFVDWWTTDNRKYTERSMARSQEHLAVIRSELRENLLPEVFCYLPFIESGYQTKIGSHAGAEGLWQFMPATARKYGLIVDGTVDERTDSKKATEAACRYINDLLATFGANAFDCAVAAYNKGEYGMVSCLRGVSWKSHWKFWDAAEKKDGCLKKETIEYVPRFLAAAIVMRRPEAFGLSRSGA
jgi:pSer/pThr/pTyr-binding forkhead associated (FHA) protein